MNIHANKMKNHIFDILSEMKKTPDRFTNYEGGLFYLLGAIV
ncbi:hypothetical protein [Natranaerovirga hydrolytica]|nr:hypothetical protein [Natranaerovirga hydrolytica]